MKKKLTQNLGLKFLAVICATILWLIVMNINDPVDEQRFSNIPVELINVEAITGEGKVYEVLDNTGVISVTVRAKRSVLETLDRDNIRAVADLSEVSVTNMVTIKLSSNKMSGQIESIDSATEFLKLNIEDVKKKQLPIEVVTTGEPAEGYVIGSVTAGQTVVRVSGPESVIARISKVQVSVDITGMTSNVSTSADIVLYDADGMVIANDSIDANIATVDVKVSILATKTVPFVYRTTGTPAEGCEMTGVITGTYEEITIAGAQSVLDTISYIEIPGEALNVTGQTESLNALIDVEDYLPAGVSIEDENYVGALGVTVEIRKLENRYITIPKERISILNVPEGCTAEIVDYASNSTIGIRAIEPVLDAVDEESLTGTVDLGAYFEQQNISEPQQGVYSIEAVFVMPDRVTQVQKLYVVIALNPITEENEE